HGTITGGMIDAGSERHGRFLSFSLNFRATAYTITTVAAGFPRSPTGEKAHEEVAAGRDGRSRAARGPGTCGRKGDARGQYSAERVQGVVQRQEPRQLAGTRRVAAAGQVVPRRTRQEAEGGEQKVPAALDRQGRRPALRRQGPEPANGEGLPRLRAV